MKTIVYIYIQTENNKKAVYKNAVITKPTCILIHKKSKVICIINVRESSKGKQKLTEIWKT